MGASSGTPAPAKTILKYIDPRSASVVDATWWAWSMAYRAAGSAARNASADTRMP
jgi:hypothetical protein